MSIVYPPSLLRGIEILSCNDARPFEKHLHDGFVLWLNSEAAEQYTVNGSSDVLETGAVSIIEPDVIHSNTPCNSQKRHLRSFYFSEEFVLNVMETCDKKRSRKYMLRTSKYLSQELWQQFSCLHQILLTGQDHMLQEERFLLAFADLFTVCGHPDASATTNASRDQRVALIADYMHEHLASSITLSQLAAITQCTEFHVIRLFKKHKGISPHAYLTQLRLEKARRHIESGESISETASACGLSDQSHLTRYFKKRYGITPGQYREQRASRHNASRP